MMHRYDNIFAKIFLRKQFPNREAFFVQLCEIPNTIIIIGYYRRTMSSLAQFGLSIILLLLSVGDTKAFESPFRLESLVSSALATQSTNQGGTTTALSGVRFRCGRSDDEPIIAFAMAKELMNPLGISSRNFVVAEDSTTGERLGWAQIRPLGPAGVDPERMNSQPGSIRTVTVEDEADDVMWDEFEEDLDADFSGGWKSTLPWTKEYKNAMKAADRRLERRAELVASEEARRKSSPSPQLWELASVYVVPSRRSEGIGKALVRSVLDQHKAFGRSKEAVYALTLSSTVDWYAQNFGFVSIDDPNDVPKPMAFEVAAGTAITKLMGNQLVCLKLPLEIMMEK